MVGSNFALSVSMTENLQERERIGVLCQGGVKMMFLTEVFPDSEGVVGGIAAGSADAQGKGRRDSDEVSCEAMSVVIGTSCHCGVTGKRAFNARRKAWSVKAKEREQKSAIVLVFPGTETISKEQLSMRVSWARCLRR